MKTLLIDGNNLIHKVQGLKTKFRENPETAQMSLIESVRTRTGRGGKAVIVFDGFGSIKKSNVIFSGVKTADEVIRKYIEDKYEKEDITVVSSDTGITGLAKICGCGVIKSEEYSKTLSAPKDHGKNINQLFIDDKEKPDGMSRKDFEEFKKYFT